MLNAADVLDTYFLDTRCTLLEIAATLDRYERGGGSVAADRDPRLRKLREALRILAADQPRPDRAEQLLMLFSDDAEPEPAATAGTPARGR